MRDIENIPPKCLSMDETSSAARKAEAKAEEKKRKALSGDSGVKKGKGKKGTKGGMTAVPRETEVTEETQPRNEVGVVNQEGAGTGASSVKHIGCETTNKKKKRKAENVGPLSYESV